MKKYNIWISIEEADEKKDTFQDIEMVKVGSDLSKKEAENFFETLKYLSEGI